MIIYLQYIPIQWSKYAISEVYMSTNKRHELILQILSERKYVTVDELSKLTYISASSIRRDLTLLQNSGLVKRSHGGVSLPETVSGIASFQDRMKKNILGKRLIAKKASSLLKDGQSIMLDGSSTTTFLLPYIAKLKSATLFTNNLSTALNAIELGIDTHCIGGRSVNSSPILSGIEAYKYISGLKPDVLFFSSQSLDAQGVISDSTEEENYIRSLMIASAEKTVFLCDAQKFNQRSLYTLTTLDKIDVAIFDTTYPDLECNCDIL